jgi:cytochrome bd-type quinol oxidase subunit 2
MKISINLFLSVLLFIGLILTVCSFILANSVADCSIHAQNAVRGLLTMGVGLFCISATMLACKCGSNFDKDGSGSESKLGTIFPVFIMLIGIVTIGLVSTIHKECEKARKMTPALITLSVFITLGSGGYLGLKIYNKVKSPTQLGSQSGGVTPSPSASSRASSDASGSSPTSLYGG